MQPVRTVFTVVLCAATLLVALPTSAAAEHPRPGDQTIRLVTPPLFVEGAFLFVCSAINLHHRAITVVLRVLDQTGSEICSRGPRELQPGEGAVQPCDSDILGDIEPVRYCEIVYRGRRRLVLGTAQFDPPSAGNTGVGAAVVAVEVP